MATWNLLKDTPAYFHGWTKWTAHPSPMENILFLIIVAFTSTAWQARTSELNNVLSELHLKIVVVW